MSTTVITTGGIAAANRAGVYGPKIEVTYFKIGSGIITPDSSMTDVDTLVYTGTTDQITYQIIDDSNILFKVTLDDSVGDFDIGNVGLFLSDGTLFALTALPGVTRKVRTNFPTTIGNRRIFNVIIQMSGVTNVTNLTVLIQDEAALPVVQTELSLPPSLVAPYPVYMVSAHTVYGRPTLALRQNATWYFIPADTDGGYGTYISSAFFHPSVMIGDTVCWSAVDDMFIKGDGTDYSKGALGLRGPGDKILTYGDVHIDATNPFVAGTVYYAGTNGTLTTVKNDFQIGVALNTSALLVTAGSSDVGKDYIDTKVAKAGDTMSGILNIASANASSDTDFLTLTPTDFGPANTRFSVHKDAVTTDWTISVKDASNLGNLHFDVLNLTAPTATYTDSSTTVATTAFVQSQKGTASDLLPTNAQVDAKIAAIVGTDPEQVPTNTQVASMIEGVTLDTLALRSNRFAKYCIADTVLIDDDRGTVVICTTPGITITLPNTIPTSVDHARDGWEVNIYNRSGGIIYIATQNLDSVTDFTLPLSLINKASLTVNRGDLSFTSYEIYNYTPGYGNAWPWGGSGGGGGPGVSSTDADSEFSGFFLLQYP